MLTVQRIHLPSDIPVVGCEITPYINVRNPDGLVTNEDFPESSPFNGCCYMRYKWYRNQVDQRFAVCSVHPTLQATLQCIVCLKEKAPVARSYHCSGKCFSDAWQHHRMLHEQAKKAAIEKGTDREEGHGRYINPLAFPPPVMERAGEPWSEIGCSRTYTPTADDINHILKFECVIINLVTRMPVGNASTTLTSRVIPAPSPVPRCMVPVNGVDYMRHLESDGRVASLGTFSVLSYNILSDAYATNEMYNHCPTWALSWSYRRQNLLREITGYHADILCLQEVQNDHFEEFLNPELEKHGYQAIYKKRTTEVYSGNPNSIDGCAVFFRKDVFSHVKKYEVEFNKAAQSVSEAVGQNSQNALNRLIKDNVALIVVLEAKFSNNGTDSGKKQLVCVANTHVNVHHEHKDVKLWQVHTLVKGLEKIAASADIPMLVCGDFNSVPGSAPHALLAMGKVDQMHPDLGTDPLNILRPLTKLNHQLPLVSAYSSFARLGMNPGLEKHKRRMDPATNEPLFTNFTRSFVGTIDYIFYTADSLTVESLLELLDGESLRKNTALPSPEWSSDHIALLAEFRCKPRIRR